MNQFKITLKPKHQEELERLRQTLGGVSPSVAIAFLLQNFAPKAINLIEGSSNSQLNGTELHQIAPSGTNQSPSSPELHPLVPTSPNQVPNQHQSAPIIPESEALLNALMERFD